MNNIDPAPVAVVELIRCNCSISKCSTNRCSCKKMSSVFTINNTFLIMLRLVSFIYNLNLIVNNTLLIILQY